MRLRTAARLLVGPLAAVAFFLPWVSGSGPLAAEEFSGYRLVSFTGALDVLADGILPAVALGLLRVAILAVAVAAVWNAVLASAFRWHPLYAISGWYLALASVALSIYTILAAEALTPPPGIVVFLAAGLLFVITEAAPGRVVFAHRAIPAEPEPVSLS